MKETESNYSIVLDRRQKLIDYVSKNSNYLPQELTDLVYGYFDSLDSYNAEESERINQFIKSQIQEEELSHKKIQCLDCLERIQTLISKEYIILNGIMSD